MIREKIEEITNVLVDNGKCNVDDKELVIYGVLRGLELSMNILTVLIISFFLGTIIESIVFLITFSSIRTFAGGYHCEKALTCYVFSCLIITIALVLSKNLTIDYLGILSMGMLIISIPIILKLAPIESNHRKLDEDEYKYFRKKTITNLIIECVIICFLAILNLYTYVFLISLGVFLTSIMLVLQVIVAKKQQN